MSRKKYIYETKEYQVSDKNLALAIKWLKKYKYYFSLTDDDIQEILIRFGQYYKEDKGTKPSSFCKMLITQLKDTQRIRREAIKRTGTEIHLDYAYNNSDIDGDYAMKLEGLISVEEELPIEEEEREAILKQKVNKYLGMMTDKQRYIYEQIFLEGRERKDVAEELGETTASIYEKLKTAKNRIKRKLNRMNGGI